MTNCEKIRFNNKHDRAPNGRGTKPGGQKRGGADSDCAYASSAESHAVYKAQSLPSVSDEDHAVQRKSLEITANPMASY